MKEYFEMKDNLIDKNVNMIKNQLHFIKRRNIQPFMQDLILVYATFFTGGNKTKAKEQLDQSQNTMSVPDLLNITFYSGAIFICAFILMFISLHQPEQFSNSNFWSFMKASNPILRFTFIIGYTLIATGFCIFVFRKYEINYLHIFELDYRQKVTEHQLCKYGMFMLFLWTIAFTLKFLSSFLYTFEARKDMLCLLLLIIFAIICF